MTPAPTLDRHLTRLGMDLMDALDSAAELLNGRYKPHSPDEYSPEEWSREVQKQLNSVADQLYALAAEASNTAKRLAELETAAGG